MSKSSDDNNGTGPFFDAFRTFGESLKLPSVTIEDVVNHNKKNIRALEEAARNTTHGAQKIMQAQRQALENTLADITHMVQDARDGGVNKENARDVVSDQIEFSKRSFETTIRNATETGEVMREVAQSNFDVFKTRMQESIEDMKGSMDKGSK